MNTSWKTRSKDNTYRHSEAAHAIIFKNHPRCETCETYERESVEEIWSWDPLSDFPEYCKKCRILLNKAKTDFYRDEISSCDSNQLFRTVAKTFRGSSLPTRPAGDDMNEMANSFANFFCSKISNIRNDLDNAPSKDLSGDVSDSCDSTVSVFAPATEDEVRKII